MSDPKDLDLLSDSELLGEEHVKELEMPEGLIEKSPYDYVVPEWAGKMSDREKLFRGVKDRLGVMRRALISPFLSNDTLRETASNIAKAIPFMDLNPEPLASKRGAQHKLAQLAREKQKYLYEKPYFNDSGYYGAGDIGTGITAGMAVPFSSGKTLLGTAAKQFLPNALFEAATNEGSVMDRLVAGGAGGIGGSAGTAVAGLAGKLGRTVAPRVANKLGLGVNKTKWQNPEFTAKQNLANEIEAPLSLGDITGGPFNIVRKAEDYFPGAFNREPTLEAQGRALIAKLHPENIVSKGVKDTKAALKEESRKIFAPVNSKVANTSILVPSGNMHGAVKELKDRFPSLFTTEIKDVQLRDLLNNFADSPNPPDLSFDEFTKIRQAVGRVGSLAKGLSSANPDYKGASKLADTAYAKAMSDVDSWGATGTSRSTKKKYEVIVSDWKSAMNKWQKEILPFENNEFYSKVSDPSISPEHTLKAISDPMIGVARDIVTAPYFAKHAPDTKKFIDTAKLLDRASKGLIEPSPEHGSHILDTLLAISHPGIVGAQTTLSKHSADPLLKDLYLSKFDDLLSSTGFAGLPTSLGREYGEIPAMGVLGLLNSLNFGEDKKDMPISSQTQIGASGR